MIDLTGNRFGKLVVLRREGLRRTRTQRMPTWLVRCDCGTEKVVLGVNLREGRTQSCGCVLIPHGMFGSPEYHAWNSMLTRCNNPADKTFKNYGARGITICARWQGDGGFIRFLEDMGRRPSPAHSIDRKNNDGNYEPTNCRWATRTEQGRNRRTSRVLTVGSESLTVTEWAERTGLGRGTIHERLRRGWSPERAVRTPKP